MESKNPKNDHIVIVTSDAEDARVKKFRIKPQLLWSVIAIVCVVFGAMLGFIVFEGHIWDKANEMMNQKIAVYQEQITELEAELAKAEEEKTVLQTENEGLNNKVTILSDTINQMVAEEEELEAQINRYATPTLVPITGSATIEEVTEGDPMNVFNAAEGAVIVATAVGTVFEIGEDADFGHKVVVDHGNGYVTIYRNKGMPMVALGDTISQGGTLFVIGNKNTRLGYQIMKDGVYMNPAELMEIKG